MNILNNRNHEIEKNQYYIKKAGKKHQMEIFHNRKVILYLLKSMYKSFDHR